jgi:hypothetical protein
MNCIREHAPKSHEAFSAALGFPIFWFVLDCAFGPYFPSDPPYPTNNQFLHAIFLGIGAVLWGVTAYLLRRSVGEPDGATSRTLALALLIFFAIALFIGFLVRHHV